jgi:hypothetical protein
LPFVRAIAAAAPNGQVTFFAPRTSAAKDLLAAEPRVAATVYFQHAGSELQRGINLIRLVALSAAIDLDPRPDHPAGAGRGACRRPGADRAGAWAAKRLHHQ